MKIRASSAGLGLLVCAVPAMAQNVYTWSGPAQGQGGAWESPSNWNPAGVPRLPGDVAGISTSPGQAVTLASRPIIRRVTLSGGLTLLPSSALYFIESVTITSGVLRVGNGGPGADAVLAPIAGTGTVVAAGGSLVLDADPADPSNARILAPSGGGIALVGTTRGRGVIQGDGTVFNSGSILGEGQGIRVVGSIAQQPAARLTGAITLANATVVGGILASGVGLAPGSTAELRDVALTAAFTIAGNGTLRVAGPLKGLGQLRVGEAPAGVGSLVFTDQAELEVDLAQPARVSIAAPGLAWLAGSVRVVSGAPPASCAQWPVVGFTGPSGATPVSGRFASVRGTPAPGYRFALQQDARGVVLRHVCAADFTLDCAVDFADFLAYLNLYNPGDAEADLDGDGSVDFNDFLVFLNAFNGPC